MLAYSQPRQQQRFTSLSAFLLNDIPVIAASLELNFLGKLSYQNFRNYTRLQQLSLYNIQYMGKLPASIVLLTLQSCLNIDIHAQEDSKVRLVNIHDCSGIFVFTRSQIDKIAIIQSNILVSFVVSKVQLLQTDGSNIDSFQFKSSEIQKIENVAAQTQQQIDRFIDGEQLELIRNHITSQLQQDILCSIDTDDGNVESNDYQKVFTHLVQFHNFKQLNNTPYCLKLCFSGTVMQNQLSIFQGIQELVLIKISYVGKIPSSVRSLKIIRNDFSSFALDGQSLQQILIEDCTHGFVQFQKLQIQILKLDNVKMKLSFLNCRIDVLDLETIVYSKQLFTIDAKTQFGKILMNQCQQFDQYVGQQSFLFNHTSNLQSSMIENSNFVQQISANLSQLRPCDLESSTRIKQVFRK